MSRAKDHDDEGVDAMDLASSFLRVPNQWVAPMLGDLPVELMDCPPTTHASEARPRMEQSVLTWTRSIEIPLQDFIIQKPPGSFPARIPRGTVLKTVLNGYRSSNLADNREGQVDESYGYCLLVEAEHLLWRVSRSLAETNEAVPSHGLDPMLESLLEGGLPPELRAFATSTGLHSYLVEGPNDLVSAISTLAQLGKTVNFISYLLVMLLHIQELLVAEVTHR